MKLRGEDVSDGLREWVKSDIKEGPRQAYDLGKFFFTVSVGTIGALAAIEKLNVTSRMDSPMVGAFVALFLSILVAINLARPKKRRLAGDTDLLTEYEKQIDVVLRQVWAWFVLWLLGTLIGGYAVRA